MSEGPAEPRYRIELTPAAIRDLKGLTRTTLKRVDSFVRSLAENPRPHVGQQPQIFEVTRDKKVVGEIFDFTQFSTITGVFVMDVEGDPTNFEILR